MYIAIISHNRLLGLCWKMLQLNTPKYTAKVSSRSFKSIHFQDMVERFRLQILYELSVGDINGSINIQDIIENAVGMALVVTLAYYPFLFTWI